MLCATLSTLFLLFCPFASAAAPERIKTVVVLDPATSEGWPEAVLINRGLRATFEAAFPGRIAILFEYLDISRFHEAGYRRLQVDFLRRKLAGRTIDLVISSFASSLDFVLEYREELFPGVPIIFLAVDPRELKTRKLPPNASTSPYRKGLIRSQR